MKPKAKQMYKPALLLLLLFATFSVSAQLKKMTATELSTYISNTKKPTVISFWATWCGSCVEEIPYFISTIKEKYNNQVELLLVSLDIRAYYSERIKSFAARKKFDVPIIWLDEKNADVFCPLLEPKWSGAIPSTLMVNNSKNYRQFYEAGLSPLQYEKSLVQLTQ